MCANTKSQSSQYFFHTTATMTKASLCRTNAVLAVTKQEVEEPMMSAEQVQGCTRQHVGSQCSGPTDPNTH